MWIFAKHGFISIVADLTNPRNLLVRGRMVGDIEAVFPSALGKVQHTPDHDYAYRVSLPRPVVIAHMMSNIEGIDYDNYKATIEDADRAHAYHLVWSVMAKFQYNMERENAQHFDRPDKPKRKRGRLRRGL